MAICTLVTLFSFVGRIRIITLYGSLGTKAVSEDIGETGTNFKKLVTTEEGLIDKVVEPDFRGGTLNHWIDGLNLEEDHIKTFEKLLMMIRYYQQGF